MIERLRLRNFKGWADTGQLRFAPITGFFGSNSSGKTSVLQSLLLMKQTTESADRVRVLDFGDERSPVSLGTYQDVIFQHDLKKTLGIEIGWQTPEPVKAEDTGRQHRWVLSSEHLFFQVEIGWERRQPVVEAMRYGLGDSRFSMTRDRAGKDEYSLSASRVGDFRLRRVRGRSWPLPSPVKFYGFPDQARAYYQNASFLSDLELQFEELYNRVYYLGPLREDPHRRYEYPGGRPQDVGRRGQNAVTALIASRLDGSINSRGWVHRRDGRRRTARITVEEHVAAWLRQLGLIHSFRLEAIDTQETLFTVLVQPTKESAEVALPDIGFGVSQVLPVLVLLAYAPENSTVIFEQPEIHLHPAVQAELADVIIEAALARNVQVVVESHSEHLLLRLQRRLAEKQLERGLAITPDDVALYFCNLERNQARVEELKVDHFGNIANWPANFFGNSLRETALMTQAAIDRRRTLPS